MTVGFEVVALSASLTWAIGGLVSAGGARTLGGPRFTRLRMYFVAPALVVIATAVGGWSTVDTNDLWLLAISGLFGLAIGDAALFEAFERLGPRRTGMLFAANAPVTALVSGFFLGEQFTLKTISGTALVFAGVAMSIAFGSRPGQSHVWENIKGPLWIGVGYGLLGALGQSVGVLFADPAFDGTLDPWAGAAIRVLVGAAALVAMRGWFERRTDIPHPGRIGLKMWGIIILSGTMAMVIGKTLVLFALDAGDPGIVSVLVSTSPALQLPIIWVITRQLPTAGAWLGSIAAAVGTGLIVL